MSDTVLLGIDDAARAAEVAALVREDSEFTVVDVAPDAEAVISALRGEDVSAVILHEDIGPLPVIDLAREIGYRFPGVGVVLVVRDLTPDLLRAALQSGVRDVLAWRPTVEELQGALRGAIEWSRRLRERMAAGPHEDGGGLPGGTVGGMMVAVAGAKGGVGATTIAVHLAMAAVGAVRERTVCLVDWDLQGGDVASLLDLSHRRTVSDLVDVAGDLAARQLENTVYVDQTGLRVLLPPEEGELAEEIHADVARRILGAIKSHYEVVVVDVGSVVTEANAVAVEMADEVLMAVTPDVPALRAANRLLSLWERLHIRKRDDVRIVVNRVNRGVEVQPDLVAKVVAAPLARTHIPAGFREVEVATNTGLPARLPEGPIRKALGRLAAEAGLSAPTRSRRSGESGAISVETVGMAGLILAVAVLLWEIVLVGYTFVLAGHAAREGARELAVGGNVEQAVRADLPQSWEENMDLSEGEDSVTVALAVPAISPRVHLPLRISVSAGTVIEDQG